MDLAELLRAWGYPAIVIGAFVEGETVLLLAGFAAHAGYLELPWVIVAAFAGSALGEQFYFLLGKRYGERIVVRFPRLQRQAARVRELLARHQTGAILSVRFLYGLRTVGPMAIGASGVRWLRFTALDSLAALAWSSGVACVGYTFGKAVELWLGDLRRIEGALAGLLVVAGALVWWLRLRRLRS